MTGNIKENKVMESIEIFGRKLTIVEDNSNTCKRCVLADICPMELLPCRDAKGNVNRRFEFVKE